MTHDARTDVFDRYLAAHVGDDTAAVLALFAEDAVVEDPVGSPPRVGRADIEPFYRSLHEANRDLRIERVGPTLVGGDQIAAHVRASLGLPGSPPPMDVIYVLRLGASGKISRLRAFY